MVSPYSQSQARQESAPHLETSRLQFKVLLLATDFSPTAEAATQVAMRFAQWLDSSIVAVHVLPPVLYSGEGPLDPSILDAAQESARVRMNKLGAEMKARSIPHQEVISTQAIVPAIQQEATTHHADLIIVGSHGAQGLEKILLGSVAEAVLRGSHVPVLVVGPHCKEAKTRFKSILLATDLEVGSLRAAQYAASFAEESNARLTLLHVVSDNTIISEDTRKEIQERLKHLFPAGADLWCHPAARVEVGNAAPQVVNAAMAEDADLIVVGIRDSGLLSNRAPWSTISRIIRGAPCPVLAVPAHSL